MQEVVVDEPYDFCLFRHNDKFLAIPSVAVHTEGIWYALLEPFPYTPFHIFADGAAFFLREGGEQSEHDFPVLGQGIDALLLEPHLNAKFPQMSHGIEQVNRVSCEPGYGFRQNNVNLSGIAIRKHTLKFGSAVRCSAYPSVGVHTGIFPFASALDKFAVIADLCGKGVECTSFLFGNSCISRYLFSDGSGGEGGLDFSYQFHCHHRLATIYHSESP